MLIYIGTDHAGYPLKESLKPFLEEEGFKVIDKGAHSLDSADDYPDFIAPVAKAVSENSGTLGIVLGGSGQGEAIQANRFKNVRAIVYYGSNTEILKLSKEHNNANVLALGARFLNEEEAKEALKIWLGTSFSGEERHKRRINKIDLND